MESDCGFKFSPRNDVMKSINELWLMYCSFWYVQMIQCLLSTNIHKYKYITITFTKCNKKQTHSKKLSIVIIDINCYAWRSSKVQRWHCRTVTFIVVSFVPCSLCTSFVVVEINLLRASEVTEFNLSPIHLYDLTVVLECSVLSIINCSSTCASNSCSS